MSNLRAYTGVDELRDRKSGLWRALLAEFVGTMLLNLFGCGSVVTGNVIAISLGFGLAVAGVIQVIGHISGGHVNPAVTLGLAVIGKVPVIRAVLYIISQSIGAIAGSAILRALSTEKMENFLGIVQLGHGITPIQGLGIEYFLAMILVMVVCGACDEGKAESKGIAPLLIGLSVSLGHIIGVPRTGAGMNPARSLGSSVVMNHYKNHWLYWIGPIFGGISGSLLYTYGLGPAKQNYASVNQDDKEQSGQTSGRKA